MGIFDHKICYFSVYKEMIRVYEKPLRMKSDHSAPPNSQYDVASNFYRVSAATDRKFMDRLTKDKT